MKKNLVTFLLLGIMSFGVIAPNTITMASEIQDSNIQQEWSDYQIIDREIEINNISKEEYIAIVADNENISLMEAELIVEERNSIGIDNLIKENISTVRSNNENIEELKKEISRATTYQQVKYTDKLASGSLAKCEVVSGFIVGINSGGNYRGIISASDEYVLATGNNPFTWEKGNCKLILHNANHVQLLAAGNVATTKTVSLSASAEAEWKSFGFSLSGSSSSARHIRKYHNIDKNFKLSN